MENWAIGLLVIAALVLAYKLLWAPKPGASADSSPSASTESMGTVQRRSRSGPSRLSRGGSGDRENFTVGEKFTSNLDSTPTDQHDRMTGSLYSDWMQDQAISPATRESHNEFVRDSTKNYQDTTGRTFALMDGHESYSPIQDWRGIAPPSGLPPKYGIGNPNQLPGHVYEGDFNEWNKLHDRLRV